MRIVEIDGKIFKFKDKFLIKDGYEHDVKPFDIFNFVVKNKDKMEDMEFIIENASIITDLFLPLLKSIKIDGPELDEVSPIEFFQFLSVGIESLGSAEKEEKKE